MNKFIIVIFIFIVFYLIYNNFDYFSNVENNNPKICCIYAYYEKNDMYKENLQYFLDNGIYDEIDYYIIINGDSTIDIQNKENVFIYKRPNVGYDFGAHSYGLKQLKQKYDYYTFINSSVKGPYLKYKCVKWYEEFLPLFKNNIKLVGTSINIFKEQEEDTIYQIAENEFGKNNYFPHIQSMFYMMPFEYLDYLNSIDFYNEEKINNITDFCELIAKYELGLSHHALKNNWGINSILQPYKDQDYTQVDNLHPNIITGDIYYHGAYYSKTIDPYDIVFFKVNRF